MISYLRMQALTRHVTTEDTNKSFQFNGIKKDVNYDYAYCLGVSPINCGLEYFQNHLQRFNCCNDEKWRDSYKLTAKPERGRYPLMELTPENFLQEVSKLSSAWDGLLNSKLQNVALCYQQATAADKASLPPRLDSKVVDIVMELGTRGILSWNQVQAQAHSMICLKKCRMGKIAF